MLGAALWSCAGTGGLAAAAPEPGYLEPSIGRPRPEDRRRRERSSRSTAPASGTRARPGSKLYAAKECHGPRRFVIAGDLRDGTVLEFQVPDKRQAGLYSVGVVEVAGEDHRLLEPDNHRAAIAR